MGLGVFDSATACRARLTCHGSSKSLDGNLLESSTGIADEMARLSTHVQWT
jgi:hypothetical protein